MENENRTSPEEDFCPICGNDMFDIAQTNHLEMDNRHRCPENILRDINAAHTNALRNDPDVGSLHERTFFQQLHDGFTILNPYEFEDDPSYSIKL